MNSQNRSLVKSTLKVVIIGGNFAGMSAARQLATLRSQCSHNTEMDIYVIDPNEHFTWTPNVHEVLSGVKNQDSVELSRQSLLSALGINYVQDSVQQLNQQEKYIVLNSDKQMHYDACIIACGYTANIPGKDPRSDPNSFTFRNAHDVAGIKDAITRLQDENKTINLTIVGGGFSGVEALGELLRMTPKHKGLNKTPLKITVVESGSQLLKNLPDVISTDIINLCQPYSVDFKFGCRVSAAYSDTITLTDGSTLESNITIWTTGGTLPSFLGQIDTQDNEPNANKGSEVANAYLQSSFADECFIAGDVAGFQKSSQQSSMGKGLSKQSYHAIDMGKSAAQNLFNFLNDKPMQAFEPTDKPTLLAFGNLNTYLISGETVIASPLLAATKEALYQVSMVKLTSPLSLHDRKKGIISRLTRSAQQLLIPELHPVNLINVVSRSRVLTFGSKQDIMPLVAGIRSTILDSI